MLKVLWSLQMQFELYRSCTAFHDFPLKDTFTTIPTIKTIHYFLSRYQSLTNYTQTTLKLHSVLVSGSLLSHSSVAELLYRCIDWSDRSDRRPSKQANHRTSVRVMPLIIGHWLLRCTDATDRRCAGQSSANQCRTLFVPKRCQSATPVKSSQPRLSMYVWSHLKPGFVWQESDDKKTSDMSSNGIIITSIEW